MRRNIYVIFLLLAHQVAAAQEILTLTPQKNVLVNAYLSGSTLKIDFSGAVEKKQLFELDMPSTANLNIRQIEGVRSTYIEAWHIDEGMGTYTIHRLFYYQISEQRFMERKPVCGEQFINLEPQKNQTTLVYSAFDATSNTWHTCTDL